MSAADPQSLLKVQHIRLLLEYVCKTSYKAKDGIGEDDCILNNCIMLFGKDYKYSLLNNAGGELCGHYPSQLVIQEYLKSEDTLHENVESIYDVTRLQNLVSQAKSARCRSRFVVPVILYEGKHICRSATIAGGAEMYGRQFYDFFTSSGAEPDNSSCRDSKSAQPSDMQIFDRIRGQDIRLLKTFNVGFIFDLMLEQKKVKFGMNVTSSEKVDKERRYVDFNIASIPYPGCEFFKEWKDNGYLATGLMFDWNQGFVDTKLDIPFVPSPPRNIDWFKYKTWDLVTLTQNYLKLLLHYIRDGDTGILVHCISGWDRTPLFISLLRLSLWAEGLVHPSLSAVEILYLTIGYDWYLFGHHFPDRLSRGEEVFFFCFTFLQYITGDEYNISRRRLKRPIGSADSIDGILFDVEKVSGSHGGSSSSISSSSSLNSTRSSVDHQIPLFFGIEPVADEDSSGFSTMQSSCSTLRVSPSSRCSLLSSNTDHAPTIQRTLAGGNGSISTSATKNLISWAASSPDQTLQYEALFKCSSSPVPVPRSIQRLTNESRVESFASCGSWQIVSGAESFRFTPSSASSNRSYSSETDGTRCHFKSLPPDGMRRQRLDEVRHLFVKQYSAVMGSCGSISSPDGPTLSSGSSGGVLTELFENFAEKVGIRSAKSGFY